MTNAAASRTTPTGRADRTGRDGFADRPQHAGRTDPTDGGEQLSLLPASNVHARFRLSRATRERGLRHVAEIRRQLAERQATHEHDNVHRLPPRRPHAA